MPTAHTRKTAMTMLIARGAPAYTMLREADRLSVSERHGRHGVMKISGRYTVYTPGRHRKP